MMSHAAPGYVLSRQVPPTSSARSSRTKSLTSFCSSLTATPRPENPVPMMATCTWGVGVPPVTVPAGLCLLISSLTVLVTACLLGERADVGDEEIASLARHAQHALLPRECFVVLEPNKP